MGDKKQNIRNNYKKNFYNVHGDKYLSQSISAQELGNYNSENRYVTQCTVEYEILEGSKIWLLIKKLKLDEK